MHVYVSDSGLQMANQRTLSLVEAGKWSLTLSVDPNGERNRCFYQCIGKHLGVETLEIINMLVIDELKLKKEVTTVDCKAFLHLDCEIIKL